MELGVVVKMMVWDAAIVNMVVVVEVLVIGVLADVGIIIVLEFALPTPYSVDAPFGVAVNLFMDVLDGVALGVLPAISVKVLADVSANAFAVVAALESPM